MGSVDENIKITEPHGYRVNLNVEATKVVDVLGVFKQPVFVSAKQKDPDFVFSVTTKGPIHLGSSFPEASVRGVHSNTKSPASMCFGFTFLSLHALVSFW
jgi:hypothetical protein